ncbi:MAG: hypothetical protein ACLR6B_01045 [Blautia sp.]
MDKLVMLIYAKKRAPLHSPPRRMPFSLYIDYTDCLFAWYYSFSVLAETDHVTGGVEISWLRDTTISEG